MKCTRLALALAGWLALAAPARADVVLLQGAAGIDTAPYSFIPSLPRGNHPTLYAVRGTDEDGFAHNFETYLRFEIPPDLLGPGEAVGHAVLWVYYSLADVIFDDQPATTPGELWCHEVLEPWTELGVTWTNRPDYGPAFDGQTGIENFGLLWCDVTALVAGWASGERPNYGVALSNPTDRLLGFYSFEAPAEIDANFRPSLAIETVPIETADVDADGVLDVDDNCALDPDPEQRDTDQDGYGNLCDPDLNNDGWVGASDFSRFRTAFQTSLGEPGFDPEADFDGDDTVSALDFSILRAFYSKQPGPSGLACAGTAPCP